MRGKDTFQNFKIFYNRLFHYAYYITLQYNSKYSPLTFLLDKLASKSMNEEKYENYKVNREDFHIGLSAYFSNYNLGMIIMLTIISCFFLLCYLIGFNFGKTLIISGILGISIELFIAYLFEDLKMQARIEHRDTPQQKKKWIIITICVAIGMLLLQAFNFYMCYLISHWKR
jgi:hypothetical protein